MKNFNLRLKSKLEINKELLSLTFLGLFFMVFGLTYHSYVFDEVFSIYASRNFGEMTKILWGQEANMWFYYFILHFWQKLGTGEAVVRSLSVVFGAASLIVLGKITNKLFGKKAALISVFLMLINVYFIICAQLARGYILSLFLTLLSMYSFANFYDKKKKILYVVSTTLAVYSHFYAGFILLAQVLTSISTKKFRNYRFYFLAIFAFLVPIFVSPSIYSNQVDWILPPTLRNLVGTSFVFAGDYPPLLVIYFVIFLSLLPTLYKNLKNPKYQLVLFWLATPVITSFLISLFVKPIFQSVYFLTSLPAFLILAAVAIRNIPYKRIAYLALLGIFVFSVARLFLWYSADTRYKWVFRNNEDDFRDAVSFVSAQARRGDAIVFYGYANKIAYEYYLRSSGQLPESTYPRVLEIATGSYRLGGGDSLPKPDLKKLSDLENERMWLLVKYSDRGFLDRDEQVKDIKKALSEKYNAEKVYEFPGIQLVLFTNELRG